MVALVIAVVVAAAVIALGSFLTSSRPRHVDEVDRFHRAANLTTEWARAGVTRPTLVDDAALPEQGTADADQRMTADVG